MTRTFTFNRPRTFLLYVPVLILMAFGIFGFIREQNVFVLVAVGISLLVLIPGIYLSFLRRLKVEKDRFTWITPGKRYHFALSELKHYGVIKYRRFRFIYVSRAEEQPFIQPESYVISDPDTFVIQFRPRAWGYISEIVKNQFPDLKPGALEKQ